MRVKKDILIKMHKLAETSHLTHEEFGLIIRNIMIEEDINDSRYETISKFTLPHFKQKEKKWEEDLVKLMMLNPKIENDYQNLYGQAKTSRKRFEEMQKRYDEKDGRNKEDEKDESEKPPKNETEEQRIERYKKNILTKEEREEEANETSEVWFTYYFEDDPMGIGNEIDIMSVKKQNVKNIPTKEFLKKLEKTTDSDTVERLIQIGNEDDWKKSYLIYSKEVRENYC